MSRHTDSRYVYIPPASVKIPNNAPNPPLPQRYSPHVGTTPPTVHMSPSDAVWRARTRKAFPIEGKSCERCGKPAQVRHHGDGQLHNLHPANIVFLCRACHVEVDPNIIPH